AANNVQQERRRKSDRVVEAAASVREVLVGARGPDSIDGSSPIAALFIAPVRKEGPEDSLPAGQNMIDSHQVRMKLVGSRVLTVVVVRAVVSAGLVGKRIILHVVEAELA